MGHLFSDVRSHPAAAYAALARSLDRLERGRCLALAQPDNHPHRSDRRDARRHQSWALGETIIFPDNTTQHITVTAANGGAFDLNEFAGSSASIITDAVSLGCPTQQRVPGRLRVRICQSCRPGTQSTAEIRLISARSEHRFCRNVLAQSPARLAFVGSDNVTVDKAGAPRPRGIASSSSKICQSLGGSPLTDFLFLNC